MSDPCEYCLNNQQDEYGSWYCAEGGALDEDEMARYLSHTTLSCLYFNRVLPAVCHSVLLKYLSTLCIWY